MVCEAEYGPCPAGKEVCHNDGDPSNTNWWNLRYDTKKGNEADKVIHGTDQFGKKNPNVKLIREEVREIRVKCDSGKYTLESLALEYRVSRGCISGIIYNLRWVEK